MGDSDRTRNALRALLRIDVEQGLATGFAVAVSRRGKPAEHVVAGMDGAGRPLTADSLFPVASITKLALALAVLRLSDARRLAAGDDLVKHLPDAAAALPGVTLRSLLTHTAGDRKSTRLNSSHVEIS